MLAQNFKSPNELGLTSDEFGAAVKVLNMLERGELVHLPKGLCDPRAAEVRGFYMRGWAGYKERDECGTVCCIGGWMEVVLREPLSKECHRRFHDLFYPDGYYGDSERYTVEAAAQAMRAKLTTGIADWSLAL
jgi:hypothetical protein